MNRTCLSFRATRRTRSRPVDTLTPALRPGRVSLPAFPLADPLPSNASATTNVTLFDSFAGTTGSSDFRSSCIEGVPLTRSPHDPPPTTATRDDRTSRFSRMESSVRAWVLRPRGVRHRLAITPMTMLPSAKGESAGTPNYMGSRGSIAPPTNPYQRFADALTDANA